MSHQHEEKQAIQQKSMAAESESGTMANSQAPPAFQLMASKGSDSAGVAQRQTSAAQECAEYMATEMTTNAGGTVCANIASNWDSWNPINKVRALVEFADMVGYGKPWDHKKQINDTWGQWQADDAGGVKWFFDIWSNMHYGYVGRACGFSNSLLLNAAGIAQALGSQIPDGYWKRRLESIGDADVFRALDDPSDQLASRLGYNLSGVSASTILSTMRANVDGLTHQAL